jgi:NAD(P)-dependent dehydrogenase (short-subunit alcohol dehydrogenase family)
MSGKRRLDGKVAIVTGAGGGIGAAICREFVAQGARVVCADLDEARAAATAGPLGEAAVALRCDVAHEEDAMAATRLALDRFGALHVLVNNAATFIPNTTVEAITLEDWNRTFAVNVTGAMLMSKHSIPAMRAAGGGSIIHMASQFGHVGVANRAWYGVAKAALIQLARCMAIDHAPDRIRVNSLSPGPIMTERILRRVGGEEAARAFYTPLLLSHRLGRAEDIAHAAVYLASDESEYATGSDFLVDGGYTAR